MKPRIDWLSVLAELLPELMLLWGYVLGKLG
jgi:hypothetical protein